MPSLRRNGSIVYDIKKDSSDNLTFVNKKQQLCCHSEGLFWVPKILMTYDKGWPWRC